MYTGQQPVQLVLRNLKQDNCWTHFIFENLFTSPAFIPPPYVAIVQNPQTTQPTDSKTRRQSCQWTFMVLFVVRQEEHIALQCSSSVENNWISGDGNEREGNGDEEEKDKDDEEEKEKEEAVEVL